MKKIFTLTLIMALCLSLWACGGDVPSGTVAQTATGAPFPGDINTAPPFAGGDSNNATTGSHISDHPWMEKLYGTWECDSDFSGCPGTITINEDGTCVFGAGNNYTEQHFNWWVSEEGSSDQLLKIIVDQGTEKAWMLEMVQTDDLRKFSISLWHHEFDGLYVPYDAPYTNMQNVQITVGESTLMAVRQTEGLPAAVVLHADQTCTVDEKTYRWQTKIDSNYSTFAVVILDGESELYQVHMNSETGQCEVRDGDVYGIYLDTAKHERIELTPENWNEYFVFSEKLSLNKNAFGDFTAFYIYFGYDLKPEFASRLYVGEAGGSWDDMEDIALEVQYVGCSANIVIDPEKESYTVTDLSSGEIAKDVATSYQQDDGLHLSVKSVGGVETDWRTPNGKYGYPTELTILRVKGYLWLTKE